MSFPQERDRIIRRAVQERRRIEQQRPSSWCSGSRTPSKVHAVIATECGLRRTIRVDVALWSRIGEVYVAASVERGSVRSAQRLPHWNEIFPYEYVMLPMRLANSSRSTDTVTQSPVRRRQARLGVATPCAGCRRRSVLADRSHRRRLPTKVTKRSNRPVPRVYCHVLV